MKTNTNNRTEKTPYHSYNTIRKIPVDNNND